MAVAALIVSTLALFASLASAGYARRQAHAASLATRIEQRRDHDERTPSFEAEIDDPNGNGSNYRLWVVLTSSEALDSIAVDLPAGCSFRFVEHISGVLDREHAESYSGRVEPRTRKVAWRVESLGDRYRGDEWLTVRATIGAEVWPVSVRVSPPYPIEQSIL